MPCHTKDSWDSGKHFRFEIGTLVYTLRVFIAGLASLRDLRPTTGMEQPCQLCLTATLEPVLPFIFGVPFFPLLWIFHVPLCVSLCVCNAAVLFRHKQTYPKSKHIMSPGMQLKQQHCEIWFGEQNGPAGYFPSTMCLGKRRRSEWAFLLGH